jgi:hypothetical protein
MSRPQKMHKPLKGNFANIINAIADGKGVAKSKPCSTDIIKASEPPKAKKS